MNLSIRTKLYAGFGIMALMVAVSGGLVLVQLRDAESSLEASKESTDGAVALADAQSALWELRYGFPQFMVSTDEATRKKIVDAESALRARVDKQFKVYGGLRLTVDERKSLKDLEDVYAKYMGARPKWFDLYGAGKIEEAQTWRAGTTTPMGGATVKGFSDLIELQKKVSAENHETSIHGFSVIRNRMVGFVFLALAVTGAIAFWVTRTITRPLKDAVAVAQRVASGDLTSVVEVTTRTKPASF